MSGQNLDFGVQDAIDRLALALRRAATGVQNPPGVDFSVNWIEATRIESSGRDFVPVIEFRVTTTSVVDVRNL